MTMPGRLLPPTVRSVFPLKFLLLQIQIQIHTQIHTRVVVRPFYVRSASELHPKLTIGQITPPAPRRPFAPTPKTLAMG
jgi:hypothetical protein